MPSRVMVGQKQARMVEMMRERAAAPRSTSDGIDFQKKEWTRAEKRVRKSLTDTCRGGGQC